MGVIDLSKLSPATFPSAEDDEFEFKCSLLSANDAKKELNHAAAAFANTGGGCFIWGVADADGNADGGVDPTVGKQDLVTWVDKVVHNVSPPVKYETKVFNECECRGHLDAGKVIIAVAIHPSAAGPHMANDNRYYIRAGRHTVPANHTLVEALWARRQVQTPMLTLTLRTNVDFVGTVVDLGIVNLNDAPALDVVLDINPKHGDVERMAKYYPIRIPMVDRLNPWYMHFERAEHLKDVLNYGVVIKVTYKDVAGNNYTIERDWELIKSLQPTVQVTVHEYNR